MSESDDNQDLKYFKVRNFEKYQHYKHRNPPWVKLYYDILSDFRFHKLSNTSKLVIIASTLLASRYQNRLLFNEEWFCWLTHIAPPIDWAEIFESTFIEPIGWSFKALRKNASKNALPETETETETEKSLAATPLDEAFEIFRVVYQKELEVPYIKTAGDFVRLAELRRALKVGTKQAPVNWDTTCHNYLQTPQSSYTLADLCKRYAVFRKGKLDRFGKPEGQAGQEESMAEKIERWSRERKAGNGSR